jgi:glutamate transport system permease protein
VLLLLAVAYVIKRLNDAGQFAYALWEPFFTPRIVQAIGDAWLDTLTMAVLAVLGALVFGVVFGVAKLSEHKPVRWFGWLVVEFFRAVPVIMLMTFTFYAIFNSLAIEQGAFWSVVLSLTVYNGAVLAEVFRAGVNALPRGQAEAAYAIGMRKTQVMNLVLLPQAVKIMIPAIISQCVVALKDTSLILIVFPIGLTKVLKQLPLSFHNLVPTTLVIASLYIVTNLVLTAIATWAQRRFVGEKEILQVGAVGEHDPAGTV